MNSRLQLSAVAELTCSPVQDPTCSPCPSTVVELNLKPWLSSGLVLAGESLSERRQWDCLSFGEPRRGCPPCPRGSASSQGRQGSLSNALLGPPHWQRGEGTHQDKGGTYQDNWADVGWQQDVVPQWAPVTLRLHVGGTLVVELEGWEERMWDRGHPEQEPRALCPCRHRGCGPAPALTVTWHQTQCRPVMPW